MLAGCGVRLCVDPQLDRLGEREVGQGEPRVGLAHGRRVLDTVGLAHYSVHGHARVDAQRDACRVHHEPGGGARDAIEELHITALPNPHPNVSLTQVLARPQGWNWTDELPEQVTNEQALIELNTDFSMKGMSAQEIVSVVKAWQSGALSRDSMLDLFRRGELLPEGRTNDDETKLIDAEKSDLPPAPRADATSGYSAALL